MCVVRGSVLTRGTLGMTREDGFAVFLWLLLARNSHQLEMKVGSYHL